MRIVLADDHAILRRGLAILLNARAEITIVAEAENGLEAVVAAIRFRPDIVIMDISMPRLNGFDATRRIRESCPSTKVIILSAFGDPGTVEESIRAGASAFIIKRSDIDELCLAMQLVATGNTYYSRELAEQMDLAELTYAARSGIPGHSDLTPREREILQLIAEGKTMKAIAVLLGISPKTVEGHNGRIMAKAGAKNRADLVRFAIGAGLARFDELPARNAGKRANPRTPVLKSVLSETASSARGEVVVDGRSRAS
ncbi:MAG: response regulator transcription factor [bacterium]